MANSFGIDIGTQNLKIFSGSNNHITNIKNTIAIVNKNQMYSYGDNAYSMFEKAPDTIDVSFPIISGVIADFDNMQTMLFEVLEKDLKGKIKGSDIVVAVPTDITEVEKKAGYDNRPAFSEWMHSMGLDFNEFTILLGFFNPFRNDSLEELLLLAVELLHVKSYGSLRLCLGGIVGNGDVADVSVLGGYCRDEQAGLLGEVDGVREQARHLLRSMEGGTV